MNIATSQPPVQLKHISIKQIESATLFQFMTVSLIDDSRELLYKFLRETGVFYLMWTVNGPE